MGVVLDHSLEDNRGKNEGRTEFRLVRIIYGKDGEHRCLRSEKIIINIVGLKCLYNVRSQAPNSLSLDHTISDIISSPSAFTKTS